MAALVGSVAAHPRNLPHIETFTDEALVFTKIAPGNGFGHWLDGLDGLDGFG